MSSSNPFRRKGAQPESRFPAIESLDTDIPPTSQPPPKTSFRADRDNETPNPPIATGKKAKVVKKVRVLSPPPLSPDSPEWPFNPPPQAEYDAPLRQDPFGVEDSDSTSLSTATPTVTPPPLLGLPGDPSEAFHNLEEQQKEQEGEVLKAARGSMNVDAFHRLLMTGVENTAPTKEADREIKAERAAISNSFSGHDVPAASAKPQAGDDDGSDASNSSLEVQFGKNKKAPPPPPSSRHGKSIKAGTKDDEANNVRRTSAEHSTPSPPEPIQSIQTSPAQTTTAKPPDSDPEQATGKKAVPAPPPRRGTGRPESKYFEGNAMSLALKGNGEETASRSSMESVPSRSSSIRQNASAPAPPPPRRQHAVRSTSLQTSPTSTTFNHSPLQHHDSAGPTLTREPSSPELSTRISGPPPPPTRTASHRRPPSVSSVDAPSRRVSVESKTALPPPPPPSRKRGSSKGSIDGPLRRGSLDRVPPAAVEEEAEQGVNILADLDALQREVDALRGSM